MTIFILDQLAEGSPLRDELSISSCLDLGISSAVSRSELLQVLAEAIPNQNLKFVPAEKPIDQDDCFFDFRHWALHIWTKENLVSTLSRRKAFEIRTDSKCLARLKFSESDDQTVEKICLHENGTKYFSDLTKEELLPLFKSEERSFNKLTFSKGMLEKNTHWVEKGRAEVAFYKKLPAALASYYPKMIAASEEKEQVSYCIETVAAFDVSRFYLSGALSTQRFKQLLQKLEIYFEKTWKISIDQSSELDFGKSILLEKLKQRLGLISDQDLQNLKIRPLFEQIYRATEEIIQKFKPQDIAWSHGDLCFSNILFATDMEIKFIDPRGIASPNDIFLPRLYDLAKLSQCALGNYDGILSGSEIEFSEQKTLFFSFLQKLNLDAKQVRLFEANLFLALLPLHQFSSEQKNKIVEASANAFNFYAN
jgi:hypothetical protein